MKMPDILSYISIPLLIFMSAFFSASEIAYASVNVFRLKQRENDKRSLSVYLAVKIAEDYNTVLTSILIGNTVVNIFASSVATVIVIGIFGSENYAFLATVIMTVIILIFGEVTPKIIAKHIPDKFSVAVSVPLYVICFILRPVTILFVLFVRLISKIWTGKVNASEKVTEDDLENIIDIVEDEGVLDSDECDLLQNALDFDDVCAYEIITPRVDMVALNIRNSYEANLKKILESNYSRLPVYEETPDNIIGVLHINHFLKERISKEKPNIRELLLPVTFVHKTMPLPDVLEKMKQTKCHIVVVLDEYGGTMGILTMEDVLEQLVGEIFDENDYEQEEFRCIDDTHFEVDGDMRLIDFFDEFDIDIEENEEFEGDDTTVGGFVTTMLEGETDEGNEFLFEFLKIRVLKSDEKRIEKISAEITESENQAI